jgi:hypothetical protein
MLDSLIHSHEILCWQQSELKMVLITHEELRKRAEHNEGRLGISDLMVPTPEHTLESLKKNVSKSYREVSLHKKVAQLKLRNVLENKYSLRTAKFSR